MIEFGVRDRIFAETWEQVKTAYAAGAGLGAIDAMGMQSLSVYLKPNKS